MTIFARIRTHSKYYLYVSVLVFSLAIPFVVAGAAVEASPTFTNYPTTSSYTTSGPVTTANGSLWYIEGTSSAPNDYIGKMTTSGTVTDYNISYPTGTSKFAIKNLTTGLDGNVWFNGCADTSGSVYAGFLNVSTGAVTFYRNTHADCYAGGSPGAITAGSDGYVWYVDDNNEAAGSTGYLFSVNPSTGATSTGYGTGVGWIPDSLTSGPDGRLWITLPANNALYAYTVSAGARTGTNIYHIPTLSSYPTSLTTGPDGNLWFVEQGVSPNKIAKITTGGTITEYAVASGVYPQALAAGSDGAVWFMDGGSTEKVGRITSSGSVTEYGVPGSMGASANSRLALGPDGALWFTYGGSLERLGY